MKKRQFFPDQHVKSALDVKAEELIEKGIRGLILDIDNTLEPYFVPDPGKAVKDWIQTLKEAGLKLYIVSNGKEARVKRFNRHLQLRYICHAGKPGSGGFLKAVEEFKLPHAQIAVIGDQIFTDVWGGNRLGMYTILARQVSPKDEWITAVKRPLEKIVLFFYRRSLKKHKKA